MTERGIIFSGEMVRALLANRKSRTRRLSKQWLKVRAGDKLWVRETFALIGDHAALHQATNIGYPVDRWRPSIHMPRWASRITLEATEDAREEKLQDITEAEAVAEGVCDLPGCEYRHPMHIAMFRDLWSTLHTKDGERWSDSPTVVRLAFKRVE